MTGSSVGFERPAIACEKCGTSVSLLLATKLFKSVKKLSDPFPAKCPCGHEAEYPKSAIECLCQCREGYVANKAKAKKPRAKGIAVIGGSYTGRGRENAEGSVETCQPAHAGISRDTDRYNQYWENEAGDL